MQVSFMEFKAVKIVDDFKPVRRFYVQFKNQIVAHDADIGPFHVRPKIVIISDGRVTTNGDLDDACDENNTHEVLIEVY